MDKHLIPRHDQDKTTHLVNSKAKGGTHKFESYVTLQLVAGPINAVLSCIREVKGSADVDFVRKFADILKKNKVKVRLLLLDREFYAVDVMDVIRLSRYRFLMPAIKNPRIKKTIIEHHEGTRKFVSRFTISNKFKKKFTFTLVITRSKKYGDSKVNIIEWYHVFATNLSAGQALKEITTLPEEYRKRWGIETGYRQIEQVRARTTSRDVLFRTVLFYTALFMYNMWAVERDIVNLLNN